MTDEKRGVAYWRLHIEDKNTKEKTHKLAFFSLTIPLHLQDNEELIFSLFEPGKEEPTEYNLSRYDELKEEIEFWKNGQGMTMKHLATELKQKNKLHDEHHGWIELVYDEFVKEWGKKIIGLLDEYIQEQCIICKEEET